MARSLVISFAAITAGVLLLCGADHPSWQAAASPAPSSIVHHSLTPPFLSTYSENGLPFWSFGGAAVITDTAVILTPPTGDSHGYLWNQQPSGLHEWQARFVVRATKKAPFSIFSSSSCDRCGVAFWHLKEPSRHQESHFFGVPDGFRGFGIILRHDGVHVVRNDGGSVNGLESVKIGGCNQEVLTLRGVEIIVEYSQPAGSLKVLIAYIDAEGLTVGSPRLCATFNGVAAELRQYFGFTAQSATSSEKGFHIAHVEVSSLNAESDASDQNNATATADFDAKLDKEDQSFWKNRGDVDPSGATVGV